MSLLSPAPMERTTPPPGVITQATPLRRRLVPEGVALKMKARVKASAEHDSCVLTWTPAAQCPIELCYLIPKQAKNGLLERLEWSWGLKRGSLVLTSRYNLIQMDVSWHRKFDSGFWFLGPKPAILASYLANIVDRATNREDWENRRRVYGIHLPHGEPLQTYHMLPTPRLRPSFSTLIRHVHPEFPDRPYSGDGPDDLELEVQQYKSPYAGLVVKSHVDPRCVIYDAGQKLDRCAPKDIDSLAEVISTTLGTSILESRTYLADLQSIYVEWTAIEPRWHKIVQSSYVPSGSSRTSLKRKADPHDDDQRLGNLSEHMERDDADASDREWYEQEQEQEQEQERFEDPSDGMAIEWTYDRAARCKDTPDLYHGSDGASVASSNSCFDFDAHRDPRRAPSQPFDVARWVAKTGREVQCGDEDVSIGCETHQDEWRSGGGSKGSAIELAHDTVMV